MLLNLAVKEDKFYLKFECKKATEYYTLVLNILRVI